MVRSKNGEMQTSITLCDMPLTKKIKMELAIETHRLCNACYLRNAFVVK